MAARADPEAEEEEEAARPSKANEVGNVVEAVEDETVIRKTLRGEDELEALMC